MANNSFVAEVTFKLKISGGGNFIILNQWGEPQKGGNQILKFQWGRQRGGQFLTQIWWGGKSLRKL